MKKIDIGLIICILVMIIIGVGYFSFDTVFSLGIMSPSVDIRTELLLIEYALLALLIVIIIFKAIIKK